MTSTTIRSWHRQMLAAAAVGAIAALLATTGVGWATASPGGEVAAAVDVAGDATLVPIAPVRVYDSRFAGEGGRLGNSASRVISVADQIDINTGAVIAAGVVPVGAVAVSFNVTITQTVKTGGTTGGWLSVAPGDAAGVTSSTVNYTQSGVTLANASISDLDVARQLRVFSGPDGTAHFLIDITGYFVDIDTTGGNETWAKVDADPTGATLLAGKGVTAVSRVAVGVFGVTFNRSVTGCAWLATRNDNADGVAAPGEIAVELGSAADPATLWVRTFNSAGAAADPSDSDGFTLHVVC